MLSLVEDWFTVGWFCADFVMILGYAGFAVDINNGVLFCVIGGESLLSRDVIAIIMV